MEGCSESFINGIISSQHISWLIVLKCFVGIMAKVGFGEQFKGFSHQYQSVCV